MLISTIIFILGTCFGSFLNVVIYRLPEKQSLNGRSHCPSCGKPLTALDLIPLLSWIFLRAKCRQCKKPISVQYPIIELITGILFLIAYHQTQVFSNFDYVFILRSWYIILACLAVFVIDLKHRLILDRITYPSIVILTVFAIVIDYAAGSLFTLNSLFFGGVISGVLIALFFFSFWYFSKGTWMGLGDVKFALVMGLALGFPSSFFAVMIASYLGVLFAIPLLLLKKAHMKTQLPFGCFLSASTLIVLLFSYQLVYLYTTYL